MRKRHIAVATVALCVAIGAVGCSAGVNGVDVTFGLELDPRKQGKAEVAIFSASDDGTAGTVLAQIKIDGPSNLWVEQYASATHQTVTKDGTTTETTTAQIGSDASESAGLFRTVIGFLIGLFTRTPGG